GRDARRPAISTAEGQRAAQPGGVETVEVAREADDVGAGLVGKAARQFPEEPLLVLLGRERPRGAALRRRHEDRERAPVAQRDAHPRGGGALVARRLDLVVEIDGGARLELEYLAVGETGLVIGNGKRREKIRSQRNRRGQRHAER